MSERECVREKERDRERDMERERARVQERGRESKRRQGVTWIWKYSPIRRVMSFVVANSCQARECQRRKVMRHPL